MNIVETICETIRCHGLIPRGKQVIVGVSGGADSIALLHTFYALKIPCTVAHLNHNLRGLDSQEDEAFVRELAGNLEFPIITKSVDVKVIAEESKLSVEMAARQARHDFFATFENAVIALAHHADDQVETFILKLARGAGVEGLSGMAYSQKIGKLQLIRPMLDLSQSDIIEWLKENRIEWREDSSNTDKSFLRNRVRHTILPLLEKELNPNIRNTILRTMNILRAENELLKHQTETMELGVNTPLAAQRRLLRDWLFQQGIENVGFDAVNEILALIRDRKGTSLFQLNDHQRVLVEYGIPRLENKHQKHAPPVQLTTETGTGWLKDHGKGAGTLPAEASFDADKVGESPIEVRGWVAGDRIAPLGMKGTRKLQDIFTDQKIPKAQREQIPVVVCRDEIIWLPGYRIARDWAVRNHAGKSVHVRIERNQPH
ncbi:MAG TPA: tRNA lysidine(34) synthetase TilS [Pontiella sp.]